MNEGEEIGEDVNEKAEDGERKRGSVIHFVFFHFLFF